MLKTTNFSNKLHAEILKLCHCAKLKPHNFVRGCKLFDNYQRVALVVLYYQSGKSLRRFLSNIDGCLTSWKHWLQLKKIPGKSTLHDWLQSFTVDFIRDLIRFSLENPNPELVAIDGSGIEAQYKSPYYKKRIKFRSKAPWHKLDIICDTQGSKQILDFSFLIKDRHDSKVAKQLFKRTKLKKSVIVADKGYFKFKHLSDLKEKEVDLIFPPKNYGKTAHNSIKHRKIRENYHKYVDLYNKRNNVESVFSSLKRVQGLRMRSKLSFMKKREMAWNILWYNIRKKFSSSIFLVRFFIQFQMKLNLTRNQNN